MCAALGAPVLFFLLLELTLRIVGFGYPTAFLLEDSRNGTRFWRQNNQFGWRFFGRQMARTPAPIFIPQQKSSNTIRVFVFGESAAYGDPQPQFGLPRMIEAMLSLRHPGKRIEVVNAAMTGINSHVLVPIARDCAKANPDVWVILTGNNEVVGPFGAGTVFGPQTPALPLIRASITLKATRTGQLLDQLRFAAQKPSADKSEWGGMLMFLDQQVPAQDPRLERVYHHFERNLRDMIRIGRGAGAGVVVSTVPVNLEDCAPFASAIRSDVAPAAREQWELFVQAASVAEQQGDLEKADAALRQAAQIDDLAAELRFRQARVALARGRIPEAREHFSAARDLDTLRFRTDSRLNELTRKIAGARDSENVLLVDAAKAFADHDPDGIPGRNWFYEHVHFTFEGNYLLARAIVPEIEKLLGDRAAGTNVGGDWPTISDCATRLGWNDWSRQRALVDVAARISDPPFTAQLNHTDQSRRIAKDLEQLAARPESDATSDALARVEASLKLAADDPYLHSLMASLQRQANDLEAATSARRKQLELLPTDGEAWTELGAVLAQQNQFEPAAEAFKRAYQLDSQNVWALQGLAQSLVRLERKGEAEKTYRTALRTKPRFGMAWLGLGTLLDEAGDKSRAAECYRNALLNRVYRAPELAALARFCRSRGWMEAASTNYLDAIKLNPVDVTLHIEAGQTFAALGQREMAASQFAEAARLAPDMVQARYLYGVELGRQGKPNEAIEEFRAAVRLMPDLVEARLNLGTALMNAGKDAEALAEFERVLEQNPENELARRSIEALRARMNSR